MTVGLVSWSMILAADCTERTADLQLVVSSSSMEVRRSNCAEHHETFWFETTRGSRGN